MVAERLHLRRPAITERRDVSSTTNPTPGQTNGDAERIGIAVRVCLVLITMYQGLVRPLLLGSCKFCPTCSEYAATALKSHGLWRGGRLAFGRLLRCHPFSPGGIDPVPKCPAGRGRTS